MPLLIASKNDENNNNENSQKHKLIIKKPNLAVVSSTESLRINKSTKLTRTYSMALNRLETRASSELTRSTSVLSKEKPAARQIQQQLETKSTKSRLIQEETSKKRTYSPSIIQKHNLNESLSKTNSSLSFNEVIDEIKKCSCILCVNQQESPLLKYEFLFQINQKTHIRHLRVNYSKHFSPISAMKLYNLMNIDCSIYSIDQNDLIAILNMKPSDRPKQHNKAPILNPQFIYIIDCRSNRHRFEQKHLNTAIYYEDILDDTVYLSPPSNQSTILVFYDENGRLSSTSCLVQAIMYKLRMCDEDTVYILLDGYERFSDLYPCMCTNTEIRSAVDRYKYLTIYPNCILENRIYLGSAIQAKTWKIIRDLGITHIINCACEHECLFVEFNIKYLHIKLEDTLSENLYDELERACNFIHGVLSLNESNKILVHCNLGISRSSSLLIAYFIKCYNLCFNSALNYLKDKRIQVEPNSNFAKQLNKFEEEILSKF